MSDDDRLRFLRVSVEPHDALYDSDDREDHYAEFVREAGVELFEKDWDEGEVSFGEERKIAEVSCLVVRRRPREDGVDVWHLADAHSASAAHACGYLERIVEDERDNDNDCYDFYRAFDVLVEYADILLIDEIGWEGATTEEVRQLVRRISDQFDVDLVFIPRSGSFADRFEGFFKAYTEDAPFLIYSKTHLWPKGPPPETPKPPEPKVTSPGGTA